MNEYGQGIVARSTQAHVGANRDVSVTSTLRTSAAGVTGVAPSTVWRIGRYACVHARGARMRDPDVYENVSSRSLACSSVLDVCSGQNNERLMSTVSPPRRIRRSGDRFIPVRDQDSALGLDSTQLRFNLQDATEHVYHASPLRIRGDAGQGVSVDAEERSIGEASPSRVSSSASPMRQRLLLMAARTRYSESGEVLDGSFSSNVMEPETSVTTTAERALENARLDWSDVFGPGSNNAVLRVPRVEDSAAVATPPRARPGSLARTIRSSSDSGLVEPETRWASGADSNTGAAAAAPTGVRSDLEALLATLSPEGRVEAAEGSFDVGAGDHAAMSLHHERPHARRHEALLRLLDRMDREQRDQWNIGSPALQAVMQQVQALLQAAALLGDGADDESVVEIAMELFADPQGIAAALPMTNDVSLMARAIVASPSRRAAGYNTIARTPGRVNPGTLTEGASYPELQGVITAPEARSGMRSTSANTNAVLALSAHLPPHAQHATVESTARAASEAAYMAQIGGLGGTGAATSMLASSLTGAARTMVSGSAPPSTYAIILENELLHEVNTTRTDIVPALEESAVESANRATSDHGSLSRWQAASMGQASPPRQASVSGAGASPARGAAPSVRASSVSTTPTVARRSLLEFSRQDANASEVDRSPQRRGTTGGSGRRGSSPVRQDTLRTSPVLAADPTVARQLGLGLRRTQRKISRVPFKVLDAPNLADDFYLNLIDWSARNILAVGLGNSVYLWNAYNSKVTKLCDLESLSQGICSVSWSQRGDLLAVGLASGQVHLYDPTKAAPVRVLTGHTARVGCLAWNGSLLANGSRDRTIMQHDIRAPAEPVRVLEAHRQEVCGLRWSFDQTQLASGGNDNKLFVWSPHAQRPLFRFAEHEAAVKAIAWSPHQHSLLASGGGTADRCIRFWNTTTGAALQCIDTGSQVCNLLWSRTVNELVSTHGYSQNQIVLWRYPGMQKVATLTGHLLRVLYLAASPDGSVIVTGAGDETLRFWSVFPPPRGSSRASNSRSVSWSSPSRPGGTRSLFTAALADMTALPSAYAPPTSSVAPVDDPWNTSSVISSSFIR